MGTSEMMVRELQRHFPARAPEWINATTMTVWGAYVILHPEVFEQPLFRILVSMSWGQPAGNFWGLLCFFVGFTRLTALFVNGAFSRTPIIRLVASLISAFVWTQITVGLWLLPESATGVVMYGAAVCVDLLSAYRASKDVGMVESNRREAKGAASGGTAGIERLRAA